MVRTRHQNILQARYELDGRRRPRNQPGRRAVAAAAAAAAVAPAARRSNRSRRRQPQAAPERPPDGPLTRRAAAQLPRLPAWYRDQSGILPEPRRPAARRLAAPPPNTNQPSRPGPTASHQPPPLVVIRKANHLRELPQPVWTETQSLFINRLPTEILTIILRFVAVKGGLPDLIRCRRVCRKWTSLVQLICSGQRALRLNLMASGDLTTRTSYRSLYFEAQTGNPIPAGQKIIAIRDRHFNPKVVTSIGRLFHKLNHLVIYHDLSDGRTTMSTLIALLKRLCNLNTFSFIMSTEVRNGTWLPRLAAAINTYLPALQRLDLFMSDYNEVKQYEFHPDVDLWDTLHQLRSFSLSCSPKNFYDMLVALGRGDRKGTLPRINLQALSIQCRLYDSDIPKLFESNSGLKSVTRLQLTCVWNREMVCTFMRHFGNVRELQLCYCRTSWEIFDSEWITGLLGLEFLESLKLIDFGLDAAATLIKAQLPCIKHLSIAAFDLISRFKADHHTRDFDGRLFCELLGTQFPFVETLEILAYEPPEAVVPLELAIRQYAKEYMKELRDDGLRLKLRAADLANAGPPKNATVRQRTN